MTGIGVDVVSVSRMQDVLRRTPRFAASCFSRAERDECDGRRAPGREYALRFAAKEAFLKALGVGVFGGVALPDVEVRRDGERARLELGPTAARALRARGAAAPHLSLSNAGDAAMAVVVLP